MRSVKNTAFLKTVPELETSIFHDTEGGVQNAGRKKTVAVSAAKVVSFKRKFFLLRFCEATMPETLLVRVPTQSR